MAKKKVEPKTAEVDLSIVELAIAEGKALIEDGKTKIDAAMAMYRMLEEFPQQTVVDAFVAGATLTHKGALTYWYNCRRKIRAERLVRD